MPGALWPKKVCIYNINLYRQGKDLLKMLPFDFGSTLIIKIILIARQPIILQYCSCESYILITFLITLKKPLSSPFAPNMLHIGRKVWFFLIVISEWLQDTLTQSHPFVQRPRLFLMWLCFLTQLNSTTKVGFLSRFAHTASYALWGSVCNTKELFYY